MSDALSWLGGLSGLADKIMLQEPDMQKVTGKTNPVDVMHALREMKNNFK